MQLLNSGRGLEVWLEPQDKVWPEQQHQLILSRGPLSYAYKLFKIELHSSSQSVNVADQQQQQQTSAKSSEHLVDGRAFDGELQLHFYNGRLASSAAHAQRLVTSSGVGGQDAPANLFASVSVFLLTVPAPVRPQGRSAPAASAATNQQQQQRNSTELPLDFLLANLDKLESQGDQIELELKRHQLEELLVDREQYIHYQGSMNRPPCAESVDWILLNKALRVDMEKFRALFERLNTNQENVRPVKPLNRRLLRTTINNLARTDRLEADRPPSTSVDQTRATNSNQLAAECDAMSSLSEPTTNKVSCA